DAGKPRFAGGLQVDDAVVAGNDFVGGVAVGDVTAAGVVPRQEIVVALGNLRLLGDAHDEDALLAESDRAKIKDADDFAFVGRWRNILRRQEARLGPGEHKSSTGRGISSLCRRNFRAHEGPLY